VKTNELHTFKIGIKANAAYIELHIPQKKSQNFKLIESILYALKYIHQQMHKISSYEVPKHEGGDFVHLLCIYYSECKVGFIN
jgi:hypothetical protein